MFVNENGVDVSHLNEQERLKCDKEYFNKAFSVLYEFGILLAHTLWRKLLPEEIDQANNFIHDQSVNMIIDGNLDSVIEILTYFKDKLSRQLDEESLMIIDINLAQTYKWKGDQEKCEELLNKRKWMTYNNKYKLAYYCLMNDYENSAKILKILDEQEEIDKDQIRNWPLFKEARTNETFQEFFSRKVWRTNIDNHHITSNWSRRGYCHGLCYWFQE